VVELTGGEHQFQLFHHQGKCLVESPRLLFGKLTVKTGTVSQKVQAALLLYEPCAKARRDVAT
jgi:hypothetical protein